MSSSVTSSLKEPAGRRRRDKLAHYIDVDAKVASFADLGSVRPQSTPKARPLFIA